jgi:hypothetical protein
LSDFRSVSTSAARYQQLSLNPLKLAGQCGKLKCCLNYELDSYLDAIKDFPNTENLKLKTARGTAVHQKTDIFKRIMWFTYFDDMSNFIAVSVDDVKKVIELNKAGQLPEQLNAIQTVAQEKDEAPDYENVVGQDSITRFDKNKNQKRNQQPRPKHQRNPGQNNPSNQQRPKQHQKTNHQHRGERNNPPKNPSNNSKPQ